MKLKNASQVKFRVDRTDTPEKRAKYPLYGVSWVRTYYEKATGRNLKRPIYGIGGTGKKRGESYYNGNYYELEREALWDLLLDSGYDPKTFLSCGSNRRMEPPVERRSYPKVSPPEGSGYGPDGLKVSKAEAPKAEAPKVESPNLYDHILDMAVEAESNPEGSAKLDEMVKRSPLFKKALKRVVPSLSAQHAKEMADKDAQYTKEMADKDAQLAIKDTQTAISDRILGDPLELLRRLLVLLEKEDFPMRTLISLIALLENDSDSSSATPGRGDSPHH